MALAPCRECGKMISTSSKFCTQCGYTLTGGDAKLMEEELLIKQSQEKFRNRVFFICRLVVYSACLGVMVYVFSIFSELL